MPRFCIALGSEKSHDTSARAYALSGREGKRAPNARLSSRKGRTEAACKFNPPDAHRGRGGNKRFPERSLWLADRTGA